MHVSSECNFSDSIVGHGAFHKDDSQYPLIHLKLLLQQRRGGSITDIDCILNPPLFQDDHVLQLLLAVETLEIHAVARELSYQGSYTMPWPAQKRQALHQIITVPFKESTSPHPSASLMSARTTPVPLDYSSQQPSLFEEYQRQLHHQHYLEMLSLQMTEPHHVSPGKPSLQEKVRRRHVAEENHIKQARVHHLDAFHMERAAELMQTPGPTSFPHPVHPLWIESSHPLRGYNRPGFGIFIVGTQRPSQPQMQTSKHVKRKGERPSLVIFDYDIEIVNERGNPILRLREYPGSIDHPDSSLGIAPSHLCPSQHCFFGSNAPTRSLRNAPPFFVCTSCQREEAFWRQALPPLLKVMKEKPRSNVTSTPPPIVPAVEPLPQSDTKPAPPLQTSVQTPKKSATKSEKKKALIARQRATKPEAHFLPYTVQSLPCMIGIPWKPSPAPETQRGESLGILLKVPSGFIPSHSIAGYKKVDRTEYSEATVLTLHLLFRFNTQRLACYCLFCPGDPLDYTLATALSSAKTQQLQIVFISDDPLPVSLGEKSITWPEEMRKQVQLLMGKAKGMGDEAAAKRRWVREHPVDRPSLVKAQSAEPAPSIPLPATLIERFAAQVLQEQIQQGRPRNTYLQSVRRAYQCHVDTSALLTLRDLFSEQSHSLLSWMPPFPASHLWFTFEHSLPLLQNETEQEVTAAWLMKEEDIHVEGKAKTSVWVGTLFTAHMRDLGVRYRYSPANSPAWTVDARHHCPTGLCKQGGEQCAQCGQGLAFWATTIHLLLRMIRGDFAVRVDAHERETTRLTQNRKNVWELTSILQTVHILRSIDADVHIVQPHSASFLSRESWLSILRSQHPELVETEIALRKAHDRYLSRSNTTIEIGEHPVTVHRRKDKPRRTRLKASHHTPTVPASTLDHQTE